ncbi:hypothetical protein QE152_g24634 [Popillia japonica]|uniref:Uncharacterized protein n=1 Tax=Popillia japonica TaxID=7064 RepID=A0AAW1K547_POPJA
MGKLVGNLSCHATADISFQKCMDLHPIAELSSRCGKYYKLFKQLLKYRMDLHPIAELSSRCGKYYKLFKQLLKYPAKLREYLQWIYVCTYIHMYNNS